MKKICDLCVDSGMCTSLGRDMCLNTVGLEEIGPKDRTQSYRWLGDKNRLPLPWSSYLYLALKEEDN